MYIIFRLFMYNSDRNKTETEMHMSTGHTFYFSIQKENTIKKNLIFSQIYYACILFYLK